MEFIRGYHNLQPHHRGCVATIGNFDGLHLGHRVIISQLTKQSWHLKLPRLVIILEPQPQEFFARSNTPPARLMRLREKLLALAEFGIERVLCLKFDYQLASMQAETFIKILLVEHLGIRHLVVGDDFRFGYHRVGDFNMLIEAGRRHGFEVTDGNSYVMDGERVSSTRIRNALRAGELDLAMRLLGRPYSIGGRIEHGERLGCTIGFPTANIRLHRRVAPVSGVYAVLLSSNKLRPWPGIANVGIRPTIGGVRKRIEVHLLDFCGDLYGQQANVNFLKYIRPEQYFESLDTLGQQIKKDEKIAREYFSKMQVTAHFVALNSERN
jgi:riboflavin kinase/FMN adenylyltransferase